MLKASKKWFLIVSIAALTITTTACGTGTDGGATDQKQGAAPSATVSASPTASPSPTTATAVKVDEAKVAEVLAQFNNATPAKVVTVSVAIAEILNELGVLPVGVPTTSSKLPAAYDQVPRVGSSHQLNLELIAKQQPDVVLAPSSLKTNLEKTLGSANLKSAFVPVDSLEELKITTVALGKVFKQEAKATAFLENHAKAEAAALELGKGKKAPKVLFLFGSAESLMFMNESTFAGSLAKKLGATNISTELQLKDAYSPLNMESIVTTNPDIIMLVTHGDPAAAAKKFEEDMKKNGSWEKLNAFKNGKIKTLDYTLFGIASIANAPAAYKELAQVLFNQ
ncbi:ABC transporter substrate-binding protein [Paenibacillus koleovorans]|uniref:ABC transporter substrate-binding protein n=1 Tax=Paenibacillus koleovorans TaxID=121608 RepID=UPI000FD9A4B9|nr:ABC transporter substrate-binding protein [Paenibacillus koleovorans]